MIDWINAVLPYRHVAPLASGGVQYIDGEGELGAVLPRALVVRGSHDAGCMIQTSFRHFRREGDADFGAENYVPHGVGEFTHIWVSGSPKFLQGHNLFGTSDLLTLVPLMAERALAACGREPTMLERASWRRGDFKLTVVDLTEMLDVGSSHDVGAVLRTLGDHARIAHREKQKEGHGGTVYFGRHSRRWALKMYSKLDELLSRQKSHQLPPGIERRDQLMEYARGTIRAELRLHSMELKKRGLDRGEAWRNIDAREVWTEYMKRVEWCGNVVLPNRDVTRLPKRLRATYALWAEGIDLRPQYTINPATGKASYAGLLSRAVYFRHRKELRENYGIDIATAPERERSVVVPLVRFVEARPKAVPQWAYGTPLLAA